MCYTDSVKSVGVDDGKVPPVPIPNTEVKLTCAEDSQLETACENRQSPTWTESSEMKVLELFCCVSGQKIVS